LWDVGAGNGFVTRALQDAGISVVALEPGQSGAAAAVNRGVGEVICGTLEALQLPDAALEGAGLFDVIEHLPDPRPLLREVRRVLRPGGVLAVTVPALGWLWSDADVLAGHARRYRRAQLVEELSDCGFTVVRSTYHFAAAVPPVLVQRRLKRRHHPANPDAQLEHLEHELAGQSPATVAIGRAVMRAERAWSKRFRVPFGTSVFAACR
jgi:SAM-dependent methyltransferase